MTKSKHDPAIIAQKMRGEEALARLNGGVDDTSRSNLARLEEDLKLVNAATNPTASRTTRLSGERAAEHNQHRAEMKALMQRSLEHYKTTTPEEDAQRSPLSEMMDEYDRIPGNADNSDAASSVASGGDDIDPTASVTSSGPEELDTPINRDPQENRIESFVERMLDKILGTSNEHQPVARPASPARAVNVAEDHLSHTDGSTNRTTANPLHGTRTDDHQGPSTGSTSS